jgi:hypothetical protein
VLELLMALGLFGALAALALLYMLVPPLTLAWVALVVTATGVVVGIPTGVVYHLVLRRELLRLGELPARWWVRPHAHHERLDEHGQKRVMPWFLTSGAGFVLILVGSAFALLAAVAYR